MLQQIQLTNLRIGLSWSQNLWNPGLITYVAAPVSWFITDVMAGSALHVANATLYLSPLVTPSDGDSITLPLFYPRFWARVEVVQSVKSLRLVITRTFEGEGAAAGPVLLFRVAAVPVGRSYDESAGRVVTLLHAPFSCTAGAVLDLSDHYATLIGPLLRPAILPVVPL